MKERKIHFNSVLHRFKKAMKVEKYVDIAGLLDMKQASFSDRKARNSWPLEKTYMICTENGINPRYVLYGEQPVELPRHDCRVPLYEWPRKGKTLEWGEPVEYIDLGKVLVKEHWKGVKVVGDSMYPDFKHNDPIFLDAQITEDDLVNGDPYGVFIQNFGLQIKEISFQPHKWVFRNSNDQKQDTWEMPSNCWVNGDIQLARIRLHLRSWTGKK